MDKLYELRDNVCEALQDIVAKGASLSRADVETALMAVKLIALIDGMGEYTEGHSGRSTRRGTNGRYYDEAPFNRSNRMGRSGHSIDDRIVDHLERMLDDAQSDYEKQKIHEWIRKIKTDK